MNKKPEYKVEFTKTASGLKGYGIFNRTGVEVHFNESEAEAHLVCRDLNERNAPLRADRAKKVAKAKKAAKKPTRIEVAVEATRTFIKNIVKDEGDVEIHTFKDKQGGIRVAEISVWRGNGNGGGGGYSWMRSQGDASDIILAVEDCILTYDIKAYRPKGWESDMDEHADAEWRLKEAIGERP
jgi:hypothetical protein